MEFSRLYQVILDQMNEAVYVRDLDMNIVYMNPAAERVSGWTFKEIHTQGLRCYEVFGEEGWTCRHRCPGDKSLETGLPLVHHEGKLQTRSGQVLDMRVSVTLLSEGGKKFGTLFVMENITELREIEQTRLKTVMALEDEIKRREHVETALRASQERLQLVADHAPVLIAQCGSDQRYKFVNRHYAELFKRRPTDLVGRLMREVLGEKAYAFTSPYIQQALAGRRVEFDAHLTDLPDGPHFFRTAYAPEFDASGAVVGFVAAINDITKHKRAELKRAEREQLITLMLNAELGCIKRVATDGTLLHMNPAGLAFIEADTEEEALGHSVFDLVAPAHRQAFEEMHRAVLNGTEQTLQFEVIGLKGTRRWMETYAVPFQNPITNQTEHLAVTHDISEQKRAAEALRLSEDRFRLIAAAANDSLWDWDLLTNALWWSETETGYFGYGPKIVPTIESWSDCLHPEDREQVLRGLHESVDGGEKSWRATYRFRRANGTYADIEDRGKIIRNERGKAIRMVGAMVDITERKQAEQRLERINECFLGFGSDPLVNIKRLTALCGELLGATCALYSRLQGELLCTVGEWQAPPDFNPVDKAEGHLCYDLIRRGGDGVLVVRHLSETSYAHADPNVSRYHLQTYIGKVVKCGNEPVGSLCAVFQHDVAPTEADERLMGILASAVGTEEERIRAEQALRLSEQSIRELQELTSEADCPFEERLQKLLQLGCRRFDLPIGLVTQVRGEQLEFTHVWAPGSAVQQGTLLQLESSFCAITLHADEPIRFEDRAKSEWRTHPACRQLGFECYLGTKLKGQERLYGTLCFLGTHPRSKRFTDADTAFLKLMARWLSGELDRRQAEEVLRHSEGRFRALYDDNPSMYFTVAPEGNVLSVNRFGAEQLGYRPEELIGRSVFSVFYEDDKRAVRRCLASAFAQPERLATWEFRKVKKTGEIIWVREAVRVLPAARNGPVALIVCNDVTAEKELQHKLMASEALFRTFMDHLPGPAFIKDAEGRHLFMNAACERLLPLTCAGWLGKTNEELFSPPVAAQFREHDQQVLSRRKAVRVTEQTVRDGETRHWLTFKFPVFDEQGSCMRLGGVAFDVTEQQRAKSAIHSLQAKLHQAVKAAQIGLWDWNTHTNQVFFSAEWKSQLGYEDHEIADRFDEWETRLHPDDHDRAIAYARRYVAHPDGEYSLEFRLRHKDGSYRWIASRASFVPEVDGTLIRLLGSHTDVTTLKEAESTLRASKDQYQSLVDTIDGIVWEANPETFQLTFVSAYAERVLGYPVNQWLSEPEFWQNHLHPDDRDWADAFCRTESLQKHNHHFEYRMIAADGRTVWLRNVVTFITNDEGATRMRGIIVDITDRKKQDFEIANLIRELDTIQRIQSTFISSADYRKSFSQALEALLALTNSEYGFIGEVLQTDDGKPYLQTHAMSDIAWNAETRALMEAKAPNLEFFNMRSLYGTVITTGEPVIANAPDTDPRRCGLPHGHPPLRSFLGVPIRKGAQMVGMIGVANRPGGYSHELLPRLNPFLTTCATLLEAVRVENSRRQTEQQLHAAHRRLRELTLSLTHIEEETRRRLSRDLHDELGQALTALKLDLGWVKECLDTQPSVEQLSSLKARIETMSGLLNLLIGTTRKLSGLLRPSLLDDFGLAAALESLAQNCAERMGIPCEISITPGLASLTLPDIFNTAVFRIAQELLTNIARHAKATEIRLILGIEESWLVLEIADNGLGMTDVAIAGRGQLGLKGVRERAELLGGTVDIASTAGQGTSVTVRLPLQSS